MSKNPPDFSESKNRLNVFDNFCVTDFTFQGSFFTRNGSIFAQEIMLRCTMKFG